MAWARGQGGRVGSVRLAWQDGAGKGELMAAPAAERWTVERFFAWQEGQSERYELVAGRPVRPMAGARNVHDDIVVNVVAELRRRLRGGPCRPFTGDGSVETLPGQIRRPDAGVDCGVRDPQGMQAARPVLVVEVLSPTTRDFDTFEKLAEYRAVESIACVLVVEPNAPEIAVLSRRDDGEWVRDVVAGLGRTVLVPELGIELPLAEIYDGVAFPPGPRALRVEEAG